MEAQAAGVIHSGWITGDFNLSDFFKNVMVPGNTRHHLFIWVFLNIVSQMCGMEKT